MQYIFHMFRYSVISHNVFHDFCLASPPPPTHYQIEPCLKPWHSLVIQTLHTCALRHTDMP